MYDAGTLACCALATLCLSKWAWEADYINFSTETLGNGFFQTLFGRGALGLAAPACYRILFPMLVAPDRTGAPYSSPEYSPGRWIVYQVLRAGAIFTALWLLATTHGLVLAMISAALFGLTIRYDYWSNTVELLAVAIVLAGSVLDWHWGYLVAIGFVLGTGRETLPILALLGSPHAIALGAGSAVGHLTVRAFAKTEEHWQGTLDYATPMWRTNWESITGANGPSAMWQVGIFLLVGGLALTTAPLLTSILLLVTAFVCRMDEPRVLTMLVPFAAMGVLRCL